MDGWMHQLISFYFMANHAVTNELHGGLSSKKNCMVVGQECLRLAKGHVA
jgi:hypothetical protein